MTSMGAEVLNWKKENAFKTSKTFLVSDWQTQNFLCLCFTDRLLNAFIIECLVLNML